MLDLSAALDVIGHEILGSLCIQFAVSWIAIIFLNKAKCENDTRTFVVNLILI
jgi:hypothetical protein